MRLNFYLECAGLIIGVILWCACSVKYGQLDLKDQIFLRMIRNTTIICALNIIACVIVRKNWFSFRIAAEIIISISFLYMVAILLELNSYLKESVENRNILISGNMVIMGIPLFLDALALLVNCGTQFVYGVTRMKGNMQIVFNAGYKIPYLLVILSFLIYLIILWKGRNGLLAKRQYEFFVIPVFLIVIHYLQYRFKSITILGFGYSVVLLLIYVYSYNATIRQDDLTHLPDIFGFERMVAYRIGNHQPMEIVSLTIVDWMDKQRKHGYNQMNYFLIRIADYLAHNTTGCVVARHNNRFFVILENEDLEQREKWEERIRNRFEHEWTVSHMKESFLVKMDTAFYQEMMPHTQEVMNWIVGGMQNEL